MKLIFVIMYLFFGLVMHIFLSNVDWLIILLALIVGVILLAFLHQKRTQQHTMKINKSKQSYEQELLKTQLEIQDEALRYASNDIHDNIGQVLSLAKMHLNAISLNVNDQNQETVNYSKQLVGKAIADLRRLSKSLNPNRIYDLGLEENIRYELDILEKVHKYSTALQVKGSVYLIPIAAQIFFFRIVQTCISSILQQKPATEIAIIMEFEPEQFCLTINNYSTDLTHTQTLENFMQDNFKNMQYRCQIIGAAFSLSDNPKGGYCIKICLPKEKLSAAE